MSTGYSDRPWDPGKQLPLGLSLTGRKKGIMKRIKKNDLLPWFIRDHDTLPAAYLASCKKFFKAGREDAEMYKRQASSLTDPGPGDSSRIIKEKEL